KCRWVASRRTSEQRRYRQVRVIEANECTAYIKPDTARKPASAAGKCARICVDSDQRSELHSIQVQLPPHRKRAQHWHITLERRLGERHAPFEARPVERSAAFEACPLKCSADLEHLLADLERCSAGSTDAAEPGPGELGGALERRPAELS